MQMVAYSAQPPKEHGYVHLAYLAAHAHGYGETQFSFGHFVVLGWLVALLLAALGFNVFGALFSWLAGKPRRTDASPARKRILSGYAKRDPMIHKLR